jgi:S-disulfanyl-L-cysteine oxidoreductase SoxD
MSSCPDRPVDRRAGRLTARGARVAGMLAGLLAAGAVMAQATSFPGIGRPATAKEIAAWDIDVRPDFKGLPAGSGSVAKGMEVWEAKCASCHGIFGESNEVFTPIVGGTTKDDIRTGRVARLTDPSFPGRTTLMKLSTVSTLWDYINRAMPWTEPKSLTVEEVYGVTAYILNMGGVLPDNFVLSNRNIAEVQAMLPNRNGKTTDHAMWPGATMGNRGRAVDVRATACMSNCGTEPRLASFLPDHARDAHGNLAEQNRIVGPQVGADTTRPPGSTSSANRPTLVAAAAASAGAAALSLAQKHNCMVCHGADARIVGPGFREVAAKHGTRPDAKDYLVSRIKGGGVGVWGHIPMPAQTIPDADAEAIARWLAEGARK